MNFSCARHPSLHWFAWFTLAGTHGVVAGSHDRSPRPDADPALGQEAAAAVGVFGADVRGEVVRPQGFSAFDIFPKAAGTEPLAGGMGLDSPEPTDTGWQRQAGFGWDDLVGLAKPRPPTVLPPLDFTQPIVEGRPAGFNPWRRREDGTAALALTSHAARSFRQAAQIGMGMPAAGGPAFQSVAAAGPLAAVVPPLAGVAGIVSLPRSLPGPVPNATAYTATALIGGTWQNPAIWNVTPATPASAQGYPNNNAGDTYHVTIPDNRSYNLNADVTISSLEVAAGMTFQNAANRNFTVLDSFNSISGTLVTASAVTMILDGATTFNSRLDLRNGAKMVNNGTMTVGAVAADFHEQDVALPFAAGYSLVNNGTVIADRPGTTTFQNWSYLNQGIIDLRQGTLQAESFTQTNAGSIFRVKAGATLKANGIFFNGGVVIASGSTLDGSSFSFKNSTLLIGETLGDIANLRLTGNAAGDAGQGRRSASSSPAPGPASMTPCSSRTG